MKHEHVILVVLSYVIGFTSAFIAFGLEPDPIHTSYTGHTSVESAAAHESTHEAIEFNDDGLFTHIDAQKVVISGRLRSGNTPGPGFHVAIPRYDTSPNGELVYYCEQQTSENDICHEYVYVMDAHVIKPINHQGEALTSAESKEGFSWTDDGKLTSESFISKSSDEPWMLEER